MYFENWFCLLELILVQLWACFPVGLDMVLVVLLLLGEVQGDQGVDSSLIDVIVSLDCSEDHFAFLFLPSG